MTTYAKSDFNFRTTTTSRGINLPMKFCEGCDINLWSCFLDEMKEQIRYLREDFVVRDTDVFICSYPRSGTNWTHEIVQMLLKGSSEFAVLFSFAETLIPSLLEEMESPRVICTHLPLRYLPPKVTEKAKIICVFRNPKDIAVSLHNFNGHINFLDYNASSFGDYLPLFLDGEVSTGSWFDHVLDWERAIEDNKTAKILALTYGDMKESLLENVKKIAKFLGASLNPKMYEEIVMKCDFKCQFKERTTNVPDLVARITKGTPNFLYRKYEMKEQIRYLREEFVVRDTDVFICTYPRSGTNWTHEIVQMLLKDSSEFAILFSFAECLIPSLLEEMESPRVICTHLPLRYLPPKVTEKAKIICVFRNPKDIAVSLHNFNGHLNFFDYNASGFGDYLPLFLDGETFRPVQSHPRMTGKEIDFPASETFAKIVGHKDDVNFKKYGLFIYPIPTGSWFDHVLDWERAFKDNKTAKILALTYEDMKESLLENVKKIAKFLGASLNPKMYEEIAMKCDFKYQFKERTTNVPDLVARITKDTPNFLYRKGEVGDWKNWFTVAQNEEFDKIYNERMKGSKLKIRFTLD